MRDDAQVHFDDNNHLMYLTRARQCSCRPTSTPSRPPADRRCTILVFGEIDWSGFDQRLLNISVRLCCANWCLIYGRYELIMHAVARGKGLRLSVVVANHFETVTGQNRRGDTIIADQGSGNELFWTEREALLKKAEAPPRKRQKLGVRPRVAEGGYKE